MFERLFNKFKKDLGIDLGTANTLVYVKGRGIIINEPSVVSVNTRTEQILAVGHVAKDMLGKTPAHIITSKPLSNGVISDFEITEKMMRYFFDKVFDGSSNIITRPRVIIGAPLEITEVEKKAINDAAVSAGAKEVWIIEEPMAAAIGCRMPVREPVGNFIIEIGGGTCEIAVISLSGIVLWKSIPIAGDEFNRNIVQYAREVFNLLLGEKQAEEIKIKIGSAVELNEAIQFPMRGRDLVTGLPKEIMISDSQVREALAKSLKTIVDNVKETLESTPPELVADIHERGILISGGGALLRGVDKLIYRAIQIPVRIADDPLTSVVRGAGILLDEPELLKEIVVKPEEKN